MKYIESNTIELKEKISNSLCKEIVSFLNADGGYIYIGIKMMVKLLESKI